jgi:hypothetical protein
VRLVVADYVLGLRQTILLAFGSLGHMGVYVLVGDKLLYLGSHVVVGKVGRLLDGSML